MNDPEYITLSENKNNFNIDNNNIIMLSLGCGKLNFLNILG